MSRRRFDEEEVARILDEAVRRTRETEAAPPRDLPVPRGLTLEELQDIGAEVGIAPQVIAASAALVTATGAGIEVRGRSLGLPQAVGGAVELPRDLTEDEWEIFLGRVRETFQAQGQVARVGASRSWRNGNLQVRLEPTTDGPALRMHTAKGDARAMTRAGAGLIGVSALSAAVSVLTGDAQAALAIGGILAPVGAALVALGAIPLPAWAKRRMEQMRALGAFAVELSSRNADAGAEPSPDPGNAADGVGS